MRTIRRYLTGLAQWQRRLAQAWDRSAWLQLDTVLSGMARSHPVGEGRGPKTPITGAQLCTLVAGDTLSDLAFRALFLTVFWSTSRMGEFAPPAVDLQLASVRRRHLRAIDAGYLVHLTYSKTDLEGVGVDVFVPRLGNTPLCPAAALAAWLAASTGILSPDAHLFQCMVDGDACWQPITYERARARMCTRLPLSANVCTHSLRRGMATLAAEARIPDSMIQLMGRWKSDTFKTYIVTPHDTIRSHVLKAFRKLSVA